MTNPLATPWIRLIDAGTGNWRSIVDDAVSEIGKLGSHPLAIRGAPFASLPTASSWRACLAVATDLKALCYSDGSKWVPLGYGPQRVGMMSQENPAGTPAGDLPASSAGWQTRTYNVTTGLSDVPATYAGGALTLNPGRWFLHWSHHYDNHTGLAQSSLLQTGAIRAWYTHVAQCQASLTSVASGMAVIDVEDGDTLDVEFQDHTDAASTVTNGQGANPNPPDGTHLTAQCYLEWTPLSDVYPGGSAFSGTAPSRPSTVPLVLGQQAWDASMGDTLRQVRRVLYGDDVLMDPRMMAPMPLPEFATTGDLPTAGDYDGCLAAVSTGGVYVSSDGVWARLAEWADEAQYSLGFGETVTADSNPGSTGVSRPASDGGWRIPINGNNVALTGGGSFELDGTDRFAVFLMAAVTGGENTRIEAFGGTAGRFIDFPMSVAAGSGATFTACLPAQLSGGSSLTITHKTATGANLSRYNAGPITTSGAAGQSGKNWDVAFMVRSLR